MRNYAFLFGLILTISNSVFGAASPEQWVARYNGLDNGDDSARDLTIDISGNIYVTGYSYDSNGYSDYATIKYDPNGNQIWAKRYNGPDNSDDSAVALAIDSSGNVYVTGSSHSSDTSTDYATLKYGPNGNQIWAKRYNGPKNDQDGAVDLAVDSSGNVYVTGTSYSSETGSDYVTVKYGPDSNQLWMASYNGPDNSSDDVVALAIDSSGNVYVTGYSNDSNGYSDYVTIKYDTNSNQLWNVRYNGSDYDFVNSLGVDISGNVYVTGYSFYSSTGYDYATVKYDPNGTQLWAARYNGPDNSYDEAFALAIDSSGNIYVAGYSYDVDTFEDYTTVKYSPDGNELWVVRYNGAANLADIPNAIALDNSDNIYITGYSNSNETGPDYATVKYDPNGNQLWVARYNGPGNSYDSAVSLVVDNSDNVYVTGNSYGSDMNYDYLTVKNNQLGYCTGQVVGDLNNDCKVDFEDFSILGSHWLECTYETPEDCL